MGKLLAFSRSFPYFCRAMKKRTTLSDYITANRKGRREAEQELLGPGFHDTTRVHRSKKNYTRKSKHKHNTADE